MADRREVLKVIAGGAGLCASAFAAFPAITALTDAPTLPGSDAAGGWFRIVRTAVLEPGRPTRVSVIGTEQDGWTRADGRRLGDVWVLRESDTVVKIFSAVCPHLGCSIELQGGRFFCPCHDSGFEFNGARKGGPSPRDMDPLQAKIENGWVFVQFKRFKLGVPDRVVG